MTSELRIYVLRFAEQGTLGRAFDQVTRHPDIASCALELDACRIRMLARPACAEPLIERLYLEGGLAWCSRHAFEHPPAEF